MLRAPLYEQIVEHPIRSPRLSRCEGKLSQLVAGQWLLPRLVAEIMVRFGPRVLKESLDLQLEAVGHQVLVETWVDQILLQHKDMVIPKIPKLPLVLWQHVFRFDGVEVTLNFLRNPMHIVLIESDDARTDLILNLMKRIIVRLAFAQKCSRRRFGSAAGYPGATGAL